jgi:hypothetical protein
LQRGAQILQRDAGGVGGEDRPWLHLRLDRGIDFLLEFELFRHRLDNEIGAAHALAHHVGNEQVERVAQGSALALDLAEEIGGALHGARNRLGLHVGKRNAKVLACAPGGDVAAHGAGADDMDVLDLVAGTCKLLHPLAQEEDADQILRSRRHHQMRERRFLGSQHRGFVAAVALPEMDQRVGGGIVLVRCGLFRLGTHAAGKHAANGAEIEQRHQRALFGALKLAGDRVLHGVTNMTLLADGIDEPQRLCPARVDGAARQHQRHRLHGIDELCEARGAAKAGMQAQHHLGEAEARI